MVFAKDTFTAIETIAKRDATSNCDVTPCNVCREDFTTGWNIRGKNNSIHKGIILQCNQCSYTAGSEQNLEEHMRKMQLLRLAVLTPSPRNELAGRKKGVLACPECGRTAGTKFDLKKPSGTNLKGFSCNYTNCCKSPSKLEVKPEDANGEGSDYP